MEGHHVLSMSTIKYPITQVAIVDMLKTIDHHNHAKHTTITIYGSTTTISFQEEVSKSLTVAGL